MANITKRKKSDGSYSYRIRVSNGLDLNGKQVFKVKSWTPSPNMTAKQEEKELNRQATLFEERVHKGLVVDDNIKFADYAAIWLENNKPNWSPITYQRYKEMLERINAGIGHIKLSQIQTAHIKAFEAELTKCKAFSTGRRKDGEKRRHTNKHLSPRTIHHYHACIRSILGSATKEGLTLRNVASSMYMNAPKVPKKEPDILDDKQAKEFVEALQHEEDIKTRVALILLIYGGFRNGELCGLEWKDIDFEHKTVRVERESEYVKDKGLITKEPKNETSKRTVPLPQCVFDLLRQYKIWYMEQQLKCGDAWTRSNRLMIGDLGTPLQPFKINKWLNRFTDRNGLPTIHPHTLRHTNCTLQIVNGVDIRTVSARAGHSKTSTTLDIYTHALRSADEKASQILDAALSPIENAQ